MVRAAQPERGRRDRRQEAHDLLVAAHQQVGDARHGGERGGGDQHVLDRGGADLAEQPVADDHEDHEQQADVEQPLREQRADHAAHQQSRARRHQHHADRVARARGQQVVAHVADDVQLLRDAPRRRPALVDEQPLPALAADERRDSVEHHGAGHREPLARGLRQARGGLANGPVDDPGERQHRHRRTDPRRARAAAGSGIGRGGGLRRRRRRGPRRCGDGRLDGAQ